MPAPSHNDRIFSGTFAHSLDEKNRITIPKPWRDGDTDDFFLIVHGSGKFIAALPPDEFLRTKESVQNNADVSPSERLEFLRYFHSQSMLCTTDRQGRLVLPDEIKRKAGLADKVVLAAGSNRFEIYSPERWEEAQGALAAKFNRVTDTAGVL
jgi:MraZ protein